MARSTVLLMAIGALLAAAIAVAATVAALRGDEEQFEAGTPERTVQDYLQAIEDRDPTAAFAFLSPGLLARCDPPREVVTQRGGTSIRATLADREVTGNTATVRVELTESFRDSPFGGGGSKQTLSFELEQVDGAWRFSQMPWPLFCMTKPPVRAP